MLIRPLTPEDAQAFQELRLRGLRECPKAFAASYEEDAETPIAEVARRLQPKADAVVIGAFDGQELVALVGIQRENMRKLAHKAFMWGMYVTPQARNRSIGTELLKFALESAKKALEVRQVTLRVNMESTVAITLYRKLGFNDFGLERGALLVDGELQDEYQMCCHIAGAA